ncbi:dethiobiotin synthase [Sinomonas sp. ASV322]|uniref:dethiobiotin synthase n=1 Tax=Sinomonas sp. ASV322 TaxID=3041920 RepID=UPI0027DB0AF6|nr:dethiobiotin synthase [Sinomonas sp. ASV322]MDQ4504378.1 dethiobiotin synthase [Sinomonas sp. ASV322]
MKLPGIVVVTGTDTGVGKTVTTAALAAALRRRGRTVAVYKPVQTGSVHGDSDISEVRRLAGAVTAAAGAVFSEPLAPRPAAEFDGAALPHLSEHVRRIRELADAHNHVVVEGAGGLLVELDDDGATVADLAQAVDDAAHDGGTRPGVVVVTRAALGTLNHTALTLEALERRGLRVLGLVLGVRPRKPGLAERDNMLRLASGDVPLVGAIPEGASDLTSEEFSERAAVWLAGLVPA